MARMRIEFAVAIAALSITSCSHPTLRELAAVDPIARVADLGSRRDGLLAERDMGALVVVVRYASGTRIVRAPYPSAVLSRETAIADRKVFASTGPDSTGILRLPPVRARGYRLCVLQFGYPGQCHLVEVVAGRVDSVAVTLTPGNAHH